MDRPKDLGKLNSTRRKILEVLRDKELKVDEIRWKCSLKDYTLTYFHLEVMRRFGFVDRVQIKEHGKEVFVYKLTELGNSAWVYLFK